MTAPFPQTMDYSGHNLPSRIECDIYDLVVEGNLPPEIRGIWYQSVPDPQYPPKLGKDTFLSGDGMVRSFTFDGEGHVDFKQRYIRTERWLLEHQARKALFGAYRNPFTDDPSVAGKRRGAANTTPFFHGGRLLAFKEDSPPWEVDPLTLETVGEWTFGGKLRSQTVTAHPRLDPATGEMHYFGYEATGLATSDVSYFVTNAKGELIREEFFKVPYCALMHDFVVTKEHVVFPGFPIVADLERMKAGGDHWGWDATKESFIGIMPRKGKVSDMRWFRARACSVFHFINGHSEGDKVHVDMCVSDVPAFEFMREAGGLHIPQYQVGGGLVRWTFDMAGRQGHPGGDLHRAGRGLPAPRGQGPDGRLQRRLPRAGGCALWSADPLRTGRCGVQHPCAPGGEDRAGDQLLPGPEPHHAGARAYRLRQARPRGLSDAHHRPSR